MKAIEISCNGKIVCQAGLPKDGNLTAILDLITPSKRNKKRKAWTSSFSVGGLSVEGEDYRFLKYFRKQITEKDEISLRIVDVKKPSRPKSQNVETIADRLRSKQNYLKHCAAELKRKA